MNEKQIKWTKSKCGELEKYIKNHFPLSDEQWESVTDYVKKVVDMSNENAEVRAALFDVIEIYDRKECECTKTVNLNGKRCGRW